MWAPQNSNHDYTPCALGRDRKQDRFGTIGGAKIPFEARGGEEAQGGSSTEVGPGVRIRFPPAWSLLRTCPPSSGRPTRSNPISGKWIQKRRAFDQRDRVLGTTPTARAWYFSGNSR